MEKRDQLLLAAKIYQNKDYFEFQSDNGTDLNMVDIEILEQMADEFEHQDMDRVNKIVFNKEDVYLCNPLIYVMIPDVLYNYLEVKEIEKDEQTTFQVKLKNATPAELMVAFQIAYNRISFEEAHQEKSPKEFEDKLIKEMQVYDVK